MQETEEKRSVFSRGLHQLNTNIEIYNNKIEECVNKLSKIEENRLSNMHDIFMRILIYEISYLKNM